MIIRQPTLTYAYYPRPGTLRYGVILDDNDVPKIITRIIHSYITMFGRNHDYIDYDIFVDDILSNAPETHYGDMCLLLNSEGREEITHIIKKYFEVQNRNQIRIDKKQRL